MAKVILKSASILVNSVDLSKRATQVAIELPDEEIDVTTFQAANKQTMKGMTDASIQVTFIQDYAASQVDETLWPLKQGEAAFPVECKPFSTAPSATNPRYKMLEAMLFNYTPISGSVGQVSTTQVTFKNVGSTGLERLTS